jgi:hypothetical protein
VEIIEGVEIIYLLYGMIRTKLHYDDVQLSIYIGNLLYDLVILPLITEEQMKMRINLTGNLAHTTMSSTKLS